MEERNYSISEGSGAPSHTEEVVGINSGSDDTEEIKKMLRLLLASQGIDYKKEVTE